MEIFVASSSLPCGRSWLDNCLMELGVMWTYMGADHPHDSIWEKIENGRWKYRHRDKPIGFDIMYPALMRAEGNVFDQPFLARGLHEYYSKAHASSPCVLVTREITEVMRSGFSRQGGSSQGSPESFANLIDPWTLLPMLECFGLYMYVWASQPNVRILRQEDFRRHPQTSLRDMCRHFGIDVSDERLDHAIQASSFAQMKQCELDTNRRLHGSDITGFLVGGRVHGSDPDVSGFETMRETFLSKIGYATSLTGYAGSPLRGFSRDVVDFLKLYRQKSEFMGLIDFDAIPVDPEARGFDGGLKGHLHRLSELHAHLSRYDTLEDRSLLNLYGWSDSYSRGLASSNFERLQL